MGGESRICQVSCSSRPVPPLRGWGEPAQVGVQGWNHPAGSEGEDAGVAVGQVPGCSAGVWPLPGVQRRGLEGLGWQ